MNMILCMHLLLLFNVQYFSAVIDCITCYEKKDPKQKVIIFHEDREVTNISDFKTIAKCTEALSALINQAEKSPHAYGFIGTINPNNYDEQYLRAMDRFDMPISNYISATRNEAREFIQKLPRIAIKDVTQKIYDINEDLLKAIIQKCIDKKLKVSQTTVVTISGYESYLKYLINLKTIETISQVVNDSAPLIFAHLYKSTTHYLENSLTEAGYTKTFNFNNLRKNDVPRTLKRLLHLCNNCGQKKSGSTCSICQNVCYCSRDCQKIDWGKHKLHCKPQETQLKS